MVSEIVALNHKIWEQVNVLILVVVEDGLRAKWQFVSSHTARSLNPCCGGRWSQSQLVSLLIFIL